MKAFVTGGSGFIGRKVVEKLVGRGYSVYALIHSQRSADIVQQLGARPVWGDINARGSMAQAMTGSDVVFHIAGWYKLGDRNWQKTERINVDGTRNVLELAFQLGVPRSVYTSSLAVYGNTHGFEPDETYMAPPGPFATEYDRTKHIAHYDVAIPLIQQGAPIIIVMPGMVYGPGDTSLAGQFMKAYYRGLFPVLPGPELTYTYAYVDDVAEGHILAAEKGRLGESYHLAGPPLSQQQAVLIWADILGRQPPAATIPARFIKALLPIIDTIEQIVPLPELLSRDAVAIIDHTYLGRSEKAESELGWSVRPLREGFEETFKAIAETTTPHDLSLPHPTRRQVTLGFLALAAVILAARFWAHRRR